MNWKQETIDKLEKYRAMTHAVKSIPLELFSLNKEAQAVQSRRPRNPQAQKAQQERLMDLMVKRQELEQCLSNAECWTQITADAMAQLTDQERSLLTMLYIDKVDPRMVCMQKNLDRSSLYRHRDAALKKLTLALYGALES